MMKRERVTVPRLLETKKRGEKIAALTAYEALIASILDEIGIDLILVGDSLGQVFAGYDTTLPVTMDQMIYHTRIVSNQVRRALVVGDMPFLSYQVGDELALRNAGRFLQEGGAKAVKIEGGRQVVKIVKRIVDIGIPVLGHVGLTPQALHRLGGHRIQARTDEDAAQLMEDARMLEDAGVFGVVLEAIPYEVAARVTESLTVPTIGIGAGPYCDGQILITQDMLGLYERLRPTYVRRYAELGVAVREACQHYMKDVKEKEFPSLSESYS